MIIGFESHLKVLDRQSWYTRGQAGSETVTNNTITKKIIRKKSLVWPQFDKFLQPDKIKDKISLEILLVVFLYRISCFKFPFSHLGPLAFKIYTKHFPFSHPLFQKFRHVYYVDDVACDNVLSGIPTGSSSPNKISQIVNPWLLIISHGMESVVHHSTPTTSNTMDIDPAQRVKSFLEIKGCGIHFGMLHEWLKKVGQWSHPSNSMDIDPLLRASQVIQQGSSAKSRLKLNGNWAHFGRLH